MHDLVAVAQPAELRYRSSRKFSETRGRRSSGYTVRTGAAQVRILCNRYANDQIDLAELEAGLEIALAEEMAENTVADDLAKLNTTRLVDVFDEEALTQRKRHALRRLYTKPKPPPPVDSTMYDMMAGHPDDPYRDPFAKRQALIGTRRGLSV